MTNEGRSTAAPPPGVYPGVPMALYQSWPCASNSQLTHLLRSPAHMKAHREAPDKDTPAKVLGTAIHARVLEPEKYATDYLVAEQCGARKKDGERCSNTGLWPLTDGSFVCGVHVKAATSTVRGGAIILSPEDAATVEGIGASIARHSVAGPLIAACTDFELSIVWDDPLTGVRCKARLDAFAPDLAGGSIPDIKSTEGGDFLDFERAILKWGYHRKAWFYLRGAKEVGLAARHFPIIAVEKEPPYAVAVYRVSDGVVTYLEDQMTALLELYAACEARQEWPAYPERVREISIPDWGWKLIDNQTAEVEERLATFRAPAKERAA